MEELSLLTYRELQAKAKFLGIPSNKSKDFLVTAILEKNKEPEDIIDQCETKKNTEEPLDLQNKTYRELQALAKQYSIPSNKSKNVLIDLIIEYQKNNSPLKKLEVSDSPLPSPLPEVELEREVGKESDLEEEIESNAVDSLRHNLEEMFLSEEQFPMSPCNSTVLPSSVPPNKHIFFLSPSASSSSTSIIDPKMEVQTISDEHYQYNVHWSLDDYTQKEGLDSIALKIDMEKENSIPSSSSSSLNQNQIQENEKPLLKVTTTPSLPPFPSPGGELNHKSGARLSSQDKLSFWLSKAGKPVTPTKPRTPLRALHPQI